MAEQRRPDTPPGLAEERVAFTVEYPEPTHPFDDSWTWETMPAALREELERRMESAERGNTITFDRVWEEIEIAATELRAAGYR